MARGTRRLGAARVGISFHAVGVPFSDLEEEAGAYRVSRDLFLALLDEVTQRPEVQLTFDDGFASDLDIVLPALLERSLAATFFPVAGRLGQRGYVDARGVGALSAAGMLIGSHGMRHRPWRGLDGQSAHEELAVARSIIEDAAGTRVTAAACPYGAYDRQVLSSLRRLGYTQVFTSDRRRAVAGAWLQPRYSVRRGDTLQTVRDRIFSPPRRRESVRAAVAGQLKAWR